jgi:DNA polymerase III alpha subunit
VAFAETYERLADLLKEQALLFLVGTVDRSRDRPSIIVRDVVPLEQSLERLTGSILLRLHGPAAAAPLPGISPPGSPQEVLQRLSTVLAQHKGPCPVYVQLRPAHKPDVRATIRVDKQWYVAPSRALVEELEDLLGGQECLVLSPRPQAAANGNGSGYGNGFARGNGGAAGRYVPRRPAPAPAEEV